MATEYVMEYDGWAKGIPLTAYVTIRDTIHKLRKEQVIRCKSCRWALEAPRVDDFHLECVLRPLSRHYTGDNDFCSHGKQR